MSDLEAQYFVQSFVRFLHKQLAERNFLPDVIESLEVAAQCLETAYNLPVVPAIAEGDPSGSATAAGGIDDHQLDKNPLSHIDVYELFQNASSVQPERKAEAENIKNDGNGLMREGKYNEALKAYNRAISLDPTNPIFYCNRAAAHSRLNDFHRAADDCKMSLRYDPNYSKAYGRLGIAYSKLNKNELAMEAYRNAVALEPNNVDYLNNLSVAQERLTGIPTLHTRVHTHALDGSEPVPIVDEIRDGNQPGPRESFLEIFDNPAIDELLWSLAEGGTTPGMIRAFTEPMRAQIEQDDGGIMNALNRHFMSQMTNNTYHGPNPPERTPPPPSQQRPPSQ